MSRFFANLLGPSFSFLVMTAPVFGQSDAKPTAQEVFDRRILPIFRSPQPSSCVQCHLAAVDLKDYILPTPEATFVSLREQGLIDLDEPRQSKLLTFIRMGEQDRDAGARLIHEDTRQAEYKAFAAWIEACCSDPMLRTLELTDSDRAGPDRPEGVIRHARRSRIVDSFVRNVWSQRMRCFPCHTPHEIDAARPAHQAALKTLKGFTEKYDAEFLERLKLFRQTPEETMDHWIALSRQPRDGVRPLLNLEAPGESLLLLKPMSKPPLKREDGQFEESSSVDPITHVGGLKMHRDDQTYKSIVAWIRDYANVVGDRYASVAELPADNWQPTQRFVRLTSVPESWGEGTPVQLFVHARNSENDAWREEPVAFTQGTVTPQRIVNGSLFLFDSEGTEEATTSEQTSAAPPAGRALIRVYVDTRGRLADDPTLLLGEDDYWGEGVIENARWREGFQRAESVSAKSMPSGD